MKRYLLIAMLFLATNVNAQTYTYEYVREVIKDSTNLIPQEIIFEEGEIVVDSRLLVISIKPEAGLPIILDLHSFSNIGGRTNFYYNGYYGTITKYMLTIQKYDRFIHYKLQNYL